MTPLAPQGKAALVGGAASIGPTPAGVADPLRGSDARRRLRRAVPPLSAAATDTRPVAAARRGRLAPLPRGTRNRAACPALPAAARTARHIVAAVQADGDETYFIMQSGRIAILRKVEIVLSRQVSSTVVALSGIHE